MKMTVNTRVRRVRRPPEKFVARPSKQGLTVLQGDMSFLEAQNITATSKINEATTSNENVQSKLRKQPLPSQSLNENQIIGRTNMKSIRACRKSFASDTTRTTQKLSQTPIDLHLEQKPEHDTQKKEKNGIKRKKSNRQNQQQPVIPLSKPSRNPDDSWICSVCGTSYSNGKINKKALNLESVRENKMKCHQCQGEKIIRKGSNGCSRISRSTVSRSTPNAISTPDSGSFSDNNKISMQLHLIDMKQEKKEDDMKKNIMEEEEIIEEIACCLCKCSVDFSDEIFFIPSDAAEMPTNTDSATAGGHTDANSEVSTLVDTRASMSGCFVDMNSMSNSLDRPPSAITDRAARKEVRDLKEEFVSGNGDGEKFVNGDNTKHLMSTASSNAKITIAPATATSNLKVGTDSPASTTKTVNTVQEASHNYYKPPFQLPHRFYNPRNGLLLCDGPQYATRRKSRGNCNDTNKHCNRAYHQFCHFIPVLCIPRGPWRCLVCQFQDDQFLKREETSLRKKPKAMAVVSSKQEKGKKMKKERDRSIKEETLAANFLSEEELHAIFQCSSAKKQSETLPLENNEEIDISSAEQRFELISAPLKAKLLHAELTNRAKSLIQTSLSKIRAAEHSIRSFTETNKARKSLIERVENMGLPQELIQCFMRVAQAKRKIKELFLAVEQIIQTRQYPDSSQAPLEGMNPNLNDSIYELMQWYTRQSADEKDPYGVLLYKLFPEGNLLRRRVEPRTNEGNIEAADVSSTTSGVSLDNLRCVCCLKGYATDENDLLLCDGAGCYRAYHMRCLEPKLTSKDLVSVGKDNNESNVNDDDDWFCPLCLAHGTLIHYAHQEYFGDEILTNPLLHDWLSSKDVFPEALMELRVSKKLKDRIRDEETDRFLSETLGISFSRSRMTQVECSYDEEEEEGDDDFDVEDHEDGETDKSDDDESNAEDESVIEKIDKEELDALSACSSIAESKNSSPSVDSKTRRRIRKSRRKKNLIHGNDRYGHLTNGEHSLERPRSPPSDIGKLDLANVVLGKRNRTKVDYRKLSDALFGDESDDEANGAALEFAYKPRATKKKRSRESRNDSLCDDGENDIDNVTTKRDKDTSKSNFTKDKVICRSAKSRLSEKFNKENVKDKTREEYYFKVDGEVEKTKTTVLSIKNIPATNKPATATTVRGSEEIGSWHCDKCKHDNVATKKRCSTCQGWKGGIRYNLIKGKSTSEARR